MTRQTLFDQAVAAHEGGRLDEAEQIYRQLLAAGDRLPSETAMLLHQRGLALAGLDRHAEAQAVFAQVLQLQPNSEPALYELGAALAAQNKITDWFAAFHAFAQRQDAARAWAPVTEKILPHKARHDSEQLAWQRAQGITSGSALHIEDGARLAGPAINPVNADDAARQWRENRPQVVVVDNLLTDEALAVLRRFCLGSTVWRNAFDSGYIGAFPEHGFSAPLLAQITEEFRTVFAGICGNLPLKYVWAFKYDSSMDGVHIHADDALVNVNFWITADEANLDPDTGGLLVWDVPAPRDWDFTKFNGTQDAVRGFLADNNAKSITVPYRANRAVIFDSELLHKTDAIRFKPGYENRRINITLLYGERGAGTLG